MIEALWLKSRTPSRRNILFRLLSTPAYPVPWSQAPELPNGFPLHLPYLGRFANDLIQLLLQRHRVGEPVKHLLVLASLLRSIDSPILDHDVTTRLFLSTHRSEPFERSGRTNSPPTAHHFFCWRRRRNFHIYQRHLRRINEIPLFDRFVPLHKTHQYRNGARRCK